MKIVTVVLGYRRPKETREILNILRQNKPENLMFFVDFPRDSSDDLLISQNDEVKSLVSMIDWECNFEYTFFEENKGPFIAYNEIMSNAFSKYDAVIYLEDDKLPHLDFLPFCIELLEKFKDDHRVRFITGLNLRTFYPKEYEFDYFFSNNSSAWGHATWKRTYEKFKLIDDFHKISYYSDQIYHKYKIIDKFKAILRQAQSYDRYGLYHGAAPSMEYYLLGPIKYLFNDLVIVPTRNLISDVGATKDTLHGDELKVLPKRIQKHFFTPTYNLEWPLKHPKFVMADSFYNDKFSTKNSIRLLNFIERSFRILYFRGFKYAYHRLIRRFYILLNKDYLKK
jgi:hypothetical protein